MTEASYNAPPQAADGPWVEIIQRMESLYADLAWAQTEAERKNEQLLRAKTFTDTIIRSMINSLVATDRDGMITIANEACCQLLGYARDDLLGKSVGMIFADGSPNAFWRGSELWQKCRAGGSATGVETVLRTLSGQDVPVSLNASMMRDRLGVVIGALLVATDLREMKRLLVDAQTAAEAEREQAAKLAEAYHQLQAIQARLVQSEKMSSLGRMAASVAHEINNPLGAIMVYSHLVLETSPEDFPGRTNLQNICRETVRCRDIVRGLLDFARPAGGTFQRADLNAIVRSAHELLKGQASFSDVEVRLDLHASPLVVRGDASQLQQAFTNLMANAAEAVNGPGLITVRSSADEPGGMLAVSVTDTGCGIRREDVERIFEPFFTTKQQGHGTGLGLAIVYGIIERHGGTVKVDSSPGRGTTFTVLLPACRTAEAGS